MRFKPTSKLGQIITAFESGGEAKAIEVGKTVGRSESTVKLWLRQYQNEKVEKKIQATDRAAAVIDPNSNRVYVYEYGDEELLATVVAKGEAVSVVRFDRIDIFGHPRAVTNKDLYPVKKIGKGKATATTGE